MDDAYSKDDICIEGIVHPRDTGNKKICILCKSVHLYSGNEEKTALLLNV